MPKAMNDVVVLLPGILGSVLERDGKEVWGLSGGAIWRAVTSLGHSVGELALKDDSSDPDKAADGVTAPRLLADLHLIPGLWKIDGYTKVVSAIKKEFELEEGANFFAFPYDWRRDNRVAAAQLAKKTAGWLADFRRRPNAAGAKLVLIGHSMGGLVARYFLECLEGWKDTRALITFGTPYRGSLNALNTLSNGLKVGSIVSADLSPFAQSLPSLHQLLPIYPCYSDGKGELARPYEATGIPNLDLEKAQAANAFHREIEAAVERHQQDPVYQQSRYAIHAVVGRKQPTFQSARLNGGKLEMLENYRGNDMEGDGTVPLVSATPIEMQANTPRIFADEQHASLQNTDSVLVNLGGILSGFNIHNDQFRAALPSAGIPLRLRLNDAYAAGSTVELSVEPGEDWVELETTLTSIDSAEAPKSQPAGSPGSPQRIVRFGSLAQGAYRVTIHGDSVTPVTGVFVVI